MEDGARRHRARSAAREINKPRVWLGFCALFFLGLADLRRPLSMRNLDLIALLSFSVSLWYFNRGDIFTSVPLAYPPLVYLLVRMVWIAWRGRLAPRSAPVWPVWVLAAATVFLAGFRVGLNVQLVERDRRRLLGRDRRRADRRTASRPTATSRSRATLKACGPADADGEIRERIQTNGRCESANPQGDTYGPVAYEAYLPGYLIIGWSGKWDDLPPRT